MLKIPPARTDKRKESMMCEPLPGAGEWSRKPGLNRQPAAYKAAALPLSYRGIKTARRGMAVWLKGGEDKMPKQKP